MKTWNISTRYNKNALIKQVGITGARSLALFSFLIMLFLPLLSHAIDIRGRVDRINPLTNQPIPFSNADVTLLQNNSIIRHTRTGRSGIYYMRNLHQGRYTIQVNQKTSVTITLDSKESQDIRPILVR